jgi:hypothetical protein
MKKKIKLDDIDVTFDPKPLTDDEKKLISEFIRLDKEKRKKSTDVRAWQPDTETPRTAKSLASCR